MTVHIQYKLATRLACAHVGVVGAAVPGGAAGPTPTPAGQQQPRRTCRCQRGFINPLSPTAGSGSVGAGPGGAQQGRGVPGLVARVREKPGALVLPSEHDVLHVGRGAGLRAVGGTLAAALCPDLNLPVTLLEAVLQRERKGLAWCVSRRPEYP